MHSVTFNLKESSANTKSQNYQDYMFLLTRNYFILTNYHQFLSHLNLLNCSNLSLIKLNVSPKKIKNYLDDFFISQKILFHLSLNFHARVSLS